MPGYLLHLGAGVLCAHGGQAQPAAIAARVRVSGQPIVTQTASYIVAGCPFTTPAGTPQPCVTAQWISAAARVTSMGQPVLLQDSHSLCVPNETPLAVAMTQLRVRGL
jgi:hypothetical protein